jgi:hypothetical protein
MNYCIGMDNGTTDDGGGESRDASLGMQVVVLADGVERGEHGSGLDDSIAIESGEE